MTTSETLETSEPSKGGESLPRTASRWSSENGQRARRFVPQAILTPLAALAAALFVAPALVEIVRSEDRLPFWDMAKYGVGGLRLQGALHDWNLWQAVVEIHNMSVWPPVWPTTLAVAFEFGRDPVLARLLMVGIWVLTIVAAAWAPGRRQAGSTLGLMCAAWLVSSPFLQGFATLNMLELPGLLLLILCLGLYDRALDDPQGPNLRVFRWLGLCSTLLFFCKYNYGLFWWIPLIMAEVRRLEGSWRAVFDRLRKVPAWIPWRRPLTWVVAAVGSAVLWVRMVGPIDTELLGMQLRMSSAGNPAYILFLLGTVQGLRTVLRDRSRWSEAWRRIRPEHHILIRWCLGPAFLWFLLPPHLKELLNFLENRDSGLGFWDGIAFYPAALAESFVVQPWIAFLVLASALPGFRDIVHGDPKRRMTALVFLVMSAALLKHPYKLDRFAVHWFWIVGWLGCQNLILGIHMALKGRGAAGRQRLVTGALPLCGAGLLLVAATCPQSSQVVDLHRLHTVPADTRQVLDRLRDLASGEDQVLVLGAWNGLSPALIEWHERLAEPPGLAQRRLWSGFEVARRRPHRLSKALSTGRFDTVVVLDMADGPFSEVFASESAWWRPLVEPLTAGSGGTYTLESDEHVAGYALRILRRRDGST